MPQPQPFVRHFTHLIWLLTHRADAADEQKLALRGALSHVLTRSQQIARTDLNISVSEAADVNPSPEELPWISELAMLMAGHSVRTLSFDGGATASDVLSLARALMVPSVADDGGVSFDARVVALGLKTIHVHLGREGFVRRATPVIGAHAASGPARTPPLGIPVVAPMPSSVSQPGALRFQPRLPKEQAPRPAERVAAPMIVGITSVREAPDETARMFESAHSVRHVPGELELLLEKIESPIDASTAAKQMQEVTRAAERRSSEDLTVDVLEIYKRFLKLEETEKDPVVRRAIVVAVRRLDQPGMLRGIAQLLPAHRELRDDATSVLARYGDSGSDVLIQLLVAAETAAERRAYRVALTHCPSAVPSLIHLLGDARWFVIRNVAELLGELGVTDADGQLVQAMRHADARVRRAAAAALARLGTPRALHALQQALTDKAPAVRLQSALGLGTIRNPRAVPMVIDALAEEEDPDVQAALLSALGRMPTPDAVERLRRAAEPGTLIKRKPVSVRLHAIQALADAGTAAAQSALRKFAKDRDKEIQAKVERLLEQAPTEARIA
ncbi:MAG: HEAT repeat domain-containing protein [Gemmatimonadaceae bacterium]